MSLAVLLGSQRLDINSDNMKVKAYKLAVTLDFNDTYHCKNISQGNRVVFIGASQEKVLVDYTQDPKKIENLESFFRGSGYIPSNFR